MTLRKDDSEAKSASQVALASFATYLCVALNTPKDEGWQLNPAEQREQYRKLIQPSTGVELGIEIPWREYDRFHISMRYRLTLPEGADGQSVHPQTISVAINRPFVAQVADIRRRLYDPFWPEYHKAKQQEVEAAKDAAEHRAIQATLIAEIPELETWWAGPSSNGIETISQHKRDRNERLPEVHSKLHRRYDYDQVAQRMREGEIEVEMNISQITPEQARQVLLLLYRPDLLVSPPTMN